MKLELKHLAPYLPYGLKCQLSKHQIKYGETHSLVVNGLSIDDSGEVNIEFLHNDDLMFSNTINPVKPILRPLADLTKLGSNETWWRDKIALGITSHLNYSEIEELLKEHYDVFNLIPAGLAIDINTI